MENIVNADQVYEIEYQMDSNKERIWNAVTARSLDDVEANDDCEFLCHGCNKMNKKNDECKESKQGECKIQNSNAENKC